MDTCTRQHETKAKGASPSKATEGNAHLYGAFLIPHPSPLQLVNSVSFFFFLVDPLHWSSDTEKNLSFLPLPFSLLLVAFYYFVLAYSYDVGFAIERKALTPLLLLLPTTRYEASEGSRLTNLGVK